MSFQDLDLYSRGANSRAEVYEMREHTPELQQELLRETQALRERTGSIIARLGKEFAEPVGGYFSSLALSLLYRGRQQKCLRYEVALDVPADGGGTYQAKVIFESAYALLEKSQKPTFDSNNDVFINFIPVNAQNAVDRRTLAFVFGNNLYDGGTHSMHMEWGTRAPLDLGDCVMLEQLLDLVER